MFSSILIEASEVFFLSGFLGLCLQILSVLHPRILHILQAGPLSISPRSVPCHYNFETSQLHLLECPLPGLGVFLSCGLFQSLSFSVAVLPSIGQNTLSITRCKSSSCDVSKRPQILRFFLLFRFS